MNFDLNAMLTAAKTAAPALAALSADGRNAALSAVKEALLKNADAILCQNALDVADAREKGMRDGLIDRLTLTRGRIEGICEGIGEVIALPDPVGEIRGGHVAPNGLRIVKISVPLGVIGVIFEARPNVTADVAALCLKSGNVCVLRGGSEALRSNAAIAQTMRDALQTSGFNPDFINLITDSDREITSRLMTANGFVDCIIPRGGAGLIRAVRDGSTVPVIETGSGICHVYIHGAADVQKAVRIVDNAKTSRPGVCNAAECLLADASIAPRALPAVKKALDRHGVQLRCCPRALAILGEGNGVIAATPQDYDTEFGDMIMSVRVVDGLQQAVEHIALHGTHHSDAIITEDYTAAQSFAAAVDSAAVYVNASTRFTDGGCFGMGAEIGISTQKLHARGPMGLRELTSTKYVIYGNGQIRE